MTVNRSGIRELQIARGLITLRWTGIPLIFGFGLLSLKYLGMSFQIEPIYILCCVLALMNVFFTIHFSLLSRQIGLTHGVSGLKRLMLKVVSGFFSSLREKGLRGFTSIPSCFTKLVGIMYLMLLETFKELAFNPFSIHNVMHTQVISDLLIIVLLTRYTGTTESPLLFLSVVPITVAGAVMGFKTGMIYTFLSVGAWLGTGFLIKYQFLPHIKFYSPVYGDLSNHGGWMISNSFIVATSLTATAFLAHRLTSVFKERIFFLNDILYRDKNHGIANSMISESTASAWMITDHLGNIEKIKVDKNGIFKASLVDKNLMQRFPQLEQYGVAYVIQALLTSGSRRSLEKIKITSDEGTEHILNARLSSFKDSENNAKILICFEDQTEQIYLKTQLEKLKNEFNEISVNFERTSLENKDLSRVLGETKNSLSEKAIEIEILQQKLRELKIEETNQANQISSLMLELANLKSSNDELRAEIHHKEMILDEVSQLIERCSDLESLTSHIEKRTCEIFNLDNSCLHVFKNEDVQQRRCEILDIRNASPRLLDVPRSNPDALDPVLFEGRPVIINAQITPEKSASMAITNGPMQRLTAYIPIRHNESVLGMMMLEKYGHEENSEILIDTISYYLKSAATAIKSAIQNNEIQTKNDRLNKNIARLYTQLDSIKSIVFASNTDDQQPFAKVLNELGKILPIKDAVMIRWHNDGTLEVCNRFDRSRQLELSEVEKELLVAIEKNPSHKVTAEIEQDETGITAFPLSQNSRLLGSLILCYSLEQGYPEEVITEFCVRLLRNHLAIHVMNEERELWESFYKENLTA